MKNLDIRRRLQNSGRKYWELADAAGISPGTLSIWLRHELTDEQRKKIDAAFAKLGVA